MKSSGWSKRSILSLATAVALVLTQGVSQASEHVTAEWPSWRGPDQNGTAHASGLPDSWSPEGENLAWKAEFIGRSTPVVLDGRACVIGRVGEGIDRQERVACYDAGQGDLLWEDRFNVYRTTVPFNRVGWASLAGDPATGNIYAHGVAGQLIGYAPDGTRLWSRFMAEEVGRYSGYGGRTQTPIVVGDLLIISFVSTLYGDLAPLRHRYFALDKTTGDIVWISTPGGQPYDFNTQSAPVAAHLSGRHMLVAGNADGWVYAMDVATGEKVWGFQLSKRGLNSTVLVQGDLVFASHSEENLDDSAQGRLVCFRGTGTGVLGRDTEVWRNDDIFAGFPSPAYKDGRLYIIDNSANLYALNAETGAAHWSQSLGTVGKSSPVLADGKIYATEVNGHMHILKPGADGVESMNTVQLKVPDGRYAEIYGSPAVAYGRVYFATEGGLYALGKSGKVKTPPRKKYKPAKPAAGKVARLQLVPALVEVRPGGRVNFTVRALDEQMKPVKAPQVDWVMAGLQGQLTSKGTFTAAADGMAHAGNVTIAAGGVEAVARVRVLPAPPWSMDFEEQEAGSLPPTWIRAGRSFSVVERDGGKVMRLGPSARGIDRRSTFVGSHQDSGYTFQADVLATQKGRRRGDVGLINSGYILDMKGAHQKLEVRSWSAELRMAKSVPFAWEMETWYQMKLRVESGPEKAVIRGKVWKRGEAEPAQWTLVAEDPHPIATGSPGIEGYAPVDVFWDNFKLTVND